MTSSRNGPPAPGCSSATTSTTAATETARSPTRPRRRGSTSTGWPGELLAELRAATNGYEVPSDGCASYEQLYQRLAALEADTHRHIHLENNVLFPAVVPSP